MCADAHAVRGGLDFWFVSGGFEIGDLGFEREDRINVGSADFQNGFLKITLVKVEKNPAHEILFLDAALAKPLIENGEHGFEGVVGGKGNTDFYVRLWAPPWWN